MKKYGRGFLEMAEYIERKALDKALTSAAVNDKDKNRRTWTTAICILHDLPAADVAPVVHGRWIDRGDYVTTAYGSLPVNRCSECHMDVTLEDFDSYCPNCGARMDGDSYAKAD